MIYIPRRKGLFSLKQNIQQSVWQNNQALELSKNKDYEKASPKIYQNVSLQELKFQTELAIEKEKKSTFELLQWLLEEETKEHKNKFTKKETLEIVTEAAGKPKRQLDELFEKVVLTKQPERARSFIQKPKLVDLGEELNTKLKKMKSIRGHDLSDQFLLNLAVDFWLSKHDLSKQTKKITQNPHYFGQSTTQTVNQTVKKLRTPYISKNNRMQIFKRDKGQCISCGSKTFLQFDHLVKFKDGGRNSSTNLVLKCRNCNLAREQFDQKHN